VEPEMNNRMPRKLAAILYADVAGYSRLTGADEDTTHRALREYLDFIASAVESMGGGVVHYAGDAVLARFDAVVDALSSALFIQNELQSRNQGISDDQKVQFRIGVNLGDVIEDRGGIYGDGVNVAARLESIADEGGICISDAVRTAIGKKLQLSFESMGEQRVKNITEPVRAFRVMIPERLNLPEVKPLYATLRPKQTMMHSSKPPVPSGKPSIAVLPFDNFSPNVDQDYFVDGFSEDLITELARFRSLSVTSRTSSFAMRGLKLDIVEIGEKLNVEYILEGSIRRFGSKLRITAQLIETQSGSHIWAEKYDRDAEEIFLVQDTVVGEIVSKLDVQVANLRIRDIGRVQPETLDAYDLWLRSKQYMQDWSFESDKQAIPLLEKAIEIDPNFAKPYSSLAGIYSSRCILLPGNSNMLEDKKLASEYASKSIRLDPLDAENYISLAWIHMLDRRWNVARQSFDKAFELNPNEANLIMSNALATACLGEPEAAVMISARAMQVNPFRPDYYLGYDAMIAFLAERYADCAAICRGMNEISPIDLGVWYAAACHYLDEPVEARQAAEDFLKQIAESWAGSNEASPENIMEWFGKITAIKQESDIWRLHEATQAVGLPSWIPAQQQVIN
jgi:TolB-like protein/class 3 adenylate cyclase/tetratricopeptide (TPR) repeat protein